MSREIQLTQGQVAIVDDEDFERVSRIKWSFHGEGYATGYDPESGQLVLMHRYILGYSTGDAVIVDHGNHDKLDNRRRNLRSGTNAQNMMNRSRTIREGFSSIYRGVAHRGGRSRNPQRVNDRGHLARMNKPWVVYYGKKYIGVFEAEDEAAYCRDLVALREEGIAAQLNFPINGLEM